MNMQMQAFDATETDISARAVLVRFSVSVWSGKKDDKRAAKVATDALGADESAGRFRKELVSAETLKEIQGIVRAARGVHEELTLPWSGDGRIMLASAVLDYSAKMSAFRAEYDAAVAAFLRSYPDAREAARQRLGAMFSEADYPKDGEIARKFSWESTFGIVPNVETDFRLNVAKEQADRLKAAMRADAEAAIRSAMGAAWARLHSAVSAMAEKLAAYKPGEPGKRAEGTFHGTLVTNLRELIDVLPGLNITGDAALAAMVERVRDTLTEHDADVLKASPKIREDVALAAMEIAEEMSAFM